MSTAQTPRLDVYPLTPHRWPNLEELFGPQGADNGCCCMWFRLRSKEARASTNAGNKAALRTIVESGEPPGLIGYLEGRPVGWCSLDPRERYPHIEHSRTLKPIDDTPVWAIVCFVVDREHRGQGVMGQMLDAAIEYAKERGARVLEAYPVEPSEKLTGFGGYTGIASVFLRAGFEEVARARDGRPIMRYYVP